MRVLFNHLVSQYEAGGFADSFAKLFYPALKDFNSKTTYSGKISEQSFFNDLNNKEAKSGEEFCILAELFFNGIGCDGSIETAMKYFNLSLTQGYHLSAYTLAFIWSDGYGVQDSRIAFIYAQQAVKFNHRETLNQYNNLFSSVATTPNTERNTTDQALNFERARNDKDLIALW